MSTPDDTAKDFLSIMGKAPPPKDAVPMDPVLGLRTEIISFFDFNIKKIQTASKAQAEVLELMMERARAGTLSHDQLERLFSLLGSDVRQASDSFFGLFRPTPGAVSPLANLLGEKDPAEAENKKQLQGLSPEKQAILDHALRIISATASRTETPPPPSPAPPAPPEPSVSFEVVSSVDDEENEDFPPGIPD